ncbi:MAG: hypothetical protein ACRYG4_25005 [Janthinobacterium lividum]
MRVLRLPRGAVAPADIEAADGAHPAAGSAALRLLMAYVDTAWALGTVGRIVARDPGAVTLGAGRVALHIDTDTHMVAVVEEHDGHRSFPRPVLVPARGRRAVRRRRCHW